MGIDVEGRLRDDLQELARFAPVFAPRDGTWTRGRRARRRDAVLVVASVVIAIVCVGGSLLTIGPASRDPGPATPPGFDGIPSHVWSVPERLLRSTDNPPADERTWDPRVVEADLAVGRGAVAYSEGNLGQLPVVVTAKDGRYHPLDLPGFSPAGIVNSPTDETVPLALSPDGTRLAYGWWDPTASLDHPMPSGIRIVDLLTGSIRTITLTGGNGIRLESISWSPDGRWLAWSGGRTRSWTPMSTNFGDPVAGRVSPAGTVDYLPGRLGNFVPAAISDNGLLAVHDTDRTRVWNGGSVRTLGREGQADARYAGRWSPSGSTLALTTFGPGAELEFLDASGTRSTSDLGTSPFGTGTDLVQPLGWLDDSAVVLLLSPRLDGGDTAASRLAIATRAGGRNEVELAEVGRIDPRVVGLTVATDLMSRNEPTISRPEPSWPPSQERVTATVVLIALAVLALAVAVLLRRRRTARPRTPRQRVLLRWLTGLGVLLTIAYLASVIAAVAGQGKLDYRLDRSTGALTFSADETMISGLPANVRAGVDYPVRILVPPAVAGSHLVFTELATGSATLHHADIRLCAAAVKGAITPQSCSISDGGARFAYSAPGVRELPAVLRFDQDQIGTELRLQYQVVGPRSEWNPFGGRSMRLYILGRVTPQA
jgi:hypothetical protein